MNCYTDESGNKFYCLNPIIPNNNYYWEYSDGIEFLTHHKSNYKNPLHREDGPACEYFYGFKVWYFHGKQIHCKDHEEFLKIISMKAFL